MGRGGHRGRRPHKSPASIARSKLRPGKRERQALQHGTADEVDPAATSGAISRAPASVAATPSHTATAASSVRDCHVRCRSCVAPASLDGACRCMSRLHPGLRWAYGRTSPFQSRVACAVDHMHHRYRYRCQAAPHHTHPLTVPTQSAALLWTAVAANKSCDGFSCIMFPAAVVSVMNRWNQAGMLDPDHRVRFKLEQYRKK